MMGRQVDKVDRLGICKIYGVVLLKVSEYKGRQGRPKC